MKNTLSFLCNALIIMMMSFVLVACCGAPNLNVPATQPAPRPIDKHPSVALVLGGGGARGYAHIGVINELQKAGVPIDLVVGASAGAIVGSLYADRGDAADAKSALMGAGFFDFADFNIPVWSPPGLITGNALQWFLIQHLHSLQFCDTKVPLVVVATDLDSGQPYVVSGGPIPPAVNASAALPGAVRPVQLYGHTLVDGSMVAPVPVEIALKYEPKVIIAVNICNDLDDEVPNTSTGIYARSFQISWNQLAEKGEKGADIVIHPKVGNGGTFDIGNKYEFYMQGVSAVDEALPALKKLLAQKGIRLRT